MKKVLFIFLLSLFFVSAKAQTYNFLTEGGKIRTLSLGSAAVDTIYRTLGKDSIQFTIGGRYHAIKDSLGAGGSTPTLQQVLTAGATLTGDNTIDAATYDFIISDTKAIGNNLIGLNGYGAGLVSDNSPVGLSEMYVASTQIELRPALGVLKIDTLNAFTDTTDWKPMVYKTSTGDVRKATYWPGGGGTPAGSNTQIQYNNSSAFGASANLTWDNANSSLLVPTSTSEANPSIASVSDVNTGISFYGSDNLAFVINGDRALGLSGVYVSLGHDKYIGWNGAGADAFAAGADVALFRNAAGVLEINSGASGTFRDLKLRHSIFTGRNQQGKGADVAAANDLTLGADGNLFHITGATTINAITTSGWQAGSEITLIFDSTPTVKNNTAGSGGTAVMKLAGGADFSATANDVLRLVYDGTAFYEISRSVN